MKFYDDTPHFFIDQVDSVEVINMTEEVNTIVMKINQEENVHHIHIWKDEDTQKLRCRITFDTVEIGINRIDNKK